MKLKLDLHPIYSDSRKIEQGLIDIIAQAVEIRASEVEIIPGKGSGALKKTVPKLKVSITELKRMTRTSDVSSFTFDFIQTSAGRAAGTRKKSMPANVFFVRVK